MIGALTRTVPSVLSICFLSPILGRPSGVPLRLRTTVFYSFISFLVVLMEFLMCRAFLRLVLLSGITGAGFAGLFVAVTVTISLIVLILF